MIEPVKKTIEVKCKPEKAFDIFTDRMSSWWPLATNTTSAMTGEVAKSVGMEPKVGGRIFEITAKGDREDWGAVKVWEPGKRLVLDWEVMVSSDEATQVEVLFHPTDDGTRVELIHTGWENLDANAQDSRDSYDSGWVNVFENRFAEACKG